MLDLRIIIVIAILVFMYVGSRRGFSLEIISTAGILLALFGLHRFDEFLRNDLLQNGSSLLHLIVQILLFSVFVIAAYHTRAVIGSRAMASFSGVSLNKRSNVQEGVLGGLTGAINGYLIGGSFWYFLYINDYPIWKEGQERVSPETIRLLPLNLLAEGPAGNGEILTLMVISVFLIVLILI